LRREELARKIAEARGRISEKRKHITDLGNHSESNTNAARIDEEINANKLESG